MYTDKGKERDNNAMTQFQKFTIEERVLWGDVDAAKIIFYGSYVRFFGIAETELFRAVGMPYGKVFDEMDIWLPRVHLECDFKRAAQLDDLRKGDDGKIEADLIATAHFVLVAAGRDDLKPVPVPEELRRALQPYAES